MPLGVKQSYHPLGDPCRCNSNPSVIPLPAIAGRAAAVLYQPLSYAAAKAASGTTVTASLASPLRVSLVPSVKPHGQGAVVLSSALPSIGAKLSQNNQYVAMKEPPASAGDSHSTPTLPVGDRLSHDMGVLLSGL